MCAVPEIGPPFSAISLLFGAEVYIQFRRKLSWILIPTLCLAPNFKQVDMFSAHLIVFNA